MGTPTTQRRASAYLRRSRVYEGASGAVSYETQLSTTRSLARRLRLPLRESDVLVDWGKSGGQGSEHRRPAYVQLRASIDAGEITDVIAYDQSRLTRSTVEWANLVVACREHHVRVHLVNGGTKDFDSADGRMTANILADVAAAERERAQERSAATIAVRRARGDILGAPRYGSGDGEESQVIIDAFKETGSYQAASRRLNEQGIPPRSIGYRRPEGATPPLWRASAVRALIRREAPQMLPLNPRRGAPTVQRRLLAGLLRCSCFGLLTGQGRDGTPISYVCSRAYSDPAHPYPRSIAEATILPWIKSEAARLRVPAKVKEAVAANGAGLARLTERKRRLSLAFSLGALDEPTYREQIVAIDAELSKIAAASRILEVPQAIPWGASPEKVNKVLRELWSEIWLDANLRPIEATWRVPEWRANPEELLPTKAHRSP